MQIKYFIFALTLLSLQSQAQDHLGSIQFGGNYNAFDHQNDFSTNTQAESERDLGATGGFNLAFPIGKSGAYLSPGLFYQVNGSNELLTEVNGLIDIAINRNVKLDYVGLQLPLQFVSKSDMGGVGLDAGLYLDYAFSGRLTNDAGNETSIVFENTFNKVDFGLNVSFTYYKDENLGLEIGYTKGLKNIEFTGENELSEDISEGDYLINHNGFTLKFKASF